MAIDRVRSWIQAASDPAILRRSVVTCLIVGTVLTTINQGDRLLRGELDATVAWKIGLTFLVPFVVADHLGSGGDSQPSRAQPDLDLDDHPSPPAGGTPGEGHNVTERSCLRHIHAPPCPATTEARMQKGGSRLRTLHQIAIGLSLASLVGIVVAGPVAADTTRTYQVTIVDRVDEGQPLTPPLLATHDGSVSLFTVGEAANLGTQEIAENGNLAPLADSLAATAGVSEVVMAAAPIVPRRSPAFGTLSDRVTLQITASEGSDFLSWESMLICTNDGFTGVDAIALPVNVGDRVTQLTAGYDAGTEINTEDFADIVPPCQELIGITSSDPGTGTTNPALAEGGVIHHHPGIEGGTDLLPSVHDWNQWVARITIVRVG